MTINREDEGLNHGNVESVISDEAVIRFTRMASEALIRFTRMASEAVIALLEQVV